MDSSGCRAAAAGALPASLEHHAVLRQPPPRPRAGPPWPPAETGEREKANGRGTSHSKLEECQMFAREGSGTNLQCFGVTRAISVVHVFAQVCSIQPRTETGSVSQSDQFS